MFPMRIAFVHNYYRLRGGEDSSVEREAQLLEKKGHQVVLWSKRSNDYLSIKNQIQVAAELSGSPRMHKEFSAFLDSFKPDIVHCHNLFPVITTSIYDACRERRIPIVQTLHNYRSFCANALLLRGGKPCELCLNGNPYNSVLYSCYQSSRLKSFTLARMIASQRKENVFSKVDSFIALSQFAKSKFVEGGFLESKIFVKPNFIDHDQDERIERDGNYALYVGRLSKEKGIGTLSEAWKNLKIPLKVAGEGPLEHLLRDNPNIEYLGNLVSSKVNQLMARARFLVVPTICYENFPLVLAEAFSFGLPVLSSDLGSTGEIVTSEVGRKFRAGNAQDLSLKAKHMWNDKELIEKLSANALQRFKKDYTAEKNLDSLLKIYGKTIENYR